MKVKDLLKMEIDVDVYDNVCEELAIAFCGPMELTEEGKEKFVEALEYDVDVDVRFNLAVVDIDYPDWKTRLRKAKEFFYGMAGYCAESDYEKWFIEG